MRDLWVYWQGDMPPYINLCIETIKRHSTGINLVLLDDYSITKYLQVPLVYKQLSVVHRADYIRVELLHKYGGIWLDADTIVLKSLTKYTKFLNKYKFIGFGKRRSPQTGIIAGRHDSLILSLWSEYINAKIRTGGISWGDLGPVALKKILIGLQPMGKHEYYNISSKYCTPVSCDDWKQFLSIRRTERETISENTFAVMLYNKFLKYELIKYNRDQLMRSNLFISKLFRRALNGC